MTDRGKQGDKKPDQQPTSQVFSQIKKEKTITLAWRRLIHDEIDEISKQFIKYAIQAFASLVLFAGFLFASIGAEWLCNIWPQSSIMVMIKIVAWIISAFGGFCCIALVLRNTILFLKFLFKSPPDETSGTNAAVERRGK